MAEATDPLGALCTLPCPPRAGEDWAAFIDAVGNLRYSEWPSDLERARLWYEPHEAHDNHERLKPQGVQILPYRCILG
jgi:DNA helicase-2/ATP-dependent DNA helicase PcrA